MCHSVKGIQEGVEVANIDGICYECEVKKIRKKWELDDDQLEAALLAVDNGAPMKIIPQIYGIPTMSLWDHNGIGKITGRKCGKLWVLSFEEDIEPINWILKMQRLAIQLT